MSISNVNRIIRDNSALLAVDKNFEKAKRIARLNRIALRLPDEVNRKKDILNVLEQLRKEIEGDKPIIDQSIHQRQIYVWTGAEADKLPAHWLPERDSLQSEQI